jgi:hypothetical protein
MKKEIKYHATIKLIELYEKTGRIAFLYPRLKKIALNGGQMLDIREAQKRMLEVINNK